jgi:HSP20 family protein
MATSRLPVTRPANPVGRWDPWREINELQAHVDELMNTVFGSLSSGAGAGWEPLADVSETDDAYVVEVDVPGVRSEDITVEATGNELVVSGEMTEKERAGLLRTRSRRAGRFEYRTSLPADIDSEAITADLADGVLSVRVPKSEAAKPRRIQISNR